MAKHPKDTPEFKRFFRNLQKLADPKAIGEAIKKSPAGKELIRKIIGEAKAGRGPGAQRYPEYSPEYREIKAKTGGIWGRWLRSKERTGRAGGMLDEKRFSFEASASGKLFVVWKRANAKMGIYAEVHQDGVGKMPKRTWMHLNSPAHAKAVLVLFRTIYKQFAASINAGRPI